MRFLGGGRWKMMYMLLVNEAQLSLGHNPVPTSIILQVRAQPPAAFTRSTCWWAVSVLMLMLALLPKRR